MFNFTTTNVINSLTDEMVKLLENKHDGEFKLARIGNFKEENILKVYKASGHKGTPAQIELKLSDLKGVEKGDAVAFDLYVGLTQDSQDSRYSNDLIFKGKPFQCEFVASDKGKVDVDKAIKIIKKFQQFVFGDEQLKVEKKGDDTIVITAQTEYQRFKKATLRRFDNSDMAYPYAGKWIKIASLEDETSTAITLVEEGTEGFGTYSFILHNLRIPTFERTRAFGINQDESPIPGAIYDQYTIHYCVDRGPLGMNAVGDQVKSVTTHVLYVNKGAEGIDKLTGVLEGLDSFEDVSEKGHDEESHKASSGSGEGSKEKTDKEIGKLEPFASKD